MVAFVLSALCGAALAGHLVVLAPRLGWLDPRPGSVPVERKAQLRPAAPVGGVALVALALAAPLGNAAAVAVLLAFAVGLVDDLRAAGLSPLQKVGGQLVAALPLAVDHGVGGVLVALVAMNAVNTFDNSDGAAAGFGVAALAGPLPTAAGALAGFLPWNLRRGGARAPKAYLGDAGSHALGMLVAVEPRAWPALALPLLDLARVVWLRARAGQAPWAGDRRHLPQALERARIAPVPRVALLALAAAPAAVAPLVSGSAGAHWIGVLATTFAFLGLCALAARRTAAGEA